MKGEASMYVGLEADRRATVEANRIQPDAEWMTTEDVKAALHISTRLLYTDGLREAVRQKSRSSYGNKGQSVGLLWNVSDVKRLAHIRKVCRLSLRSACRVAIAQREGKL